MEPCAHSDWWKPHVLSEYKTQKKRVLLFFATLSLYLYYFYMKKTLACSSCFSHSLVFSNVRRVLSRCNTRLRLLYLNCEGKKRQ